MILRTEAPTTSVCVTNFVPQDLSSDGLAPAVMSAVLAFLLFFGILTTRKRLL